MPQIFGIEHILFMLFFLLLYILTPILCHKFIKTEKQSNLLIKSIATLLLISISINRIFITKANDWDLSYLIPNSLCGLSSLVLSVLVLFSNKNSTVYHGVWYIAIIGAICTFFYPDFISQNKSVFYINTISGIFHHNISLLLCIVLIERGWFKPSLKQIKLTIISYSCYILFGLILITMCGFSDAMYIMTPVLPDTCLNWFVLLILGVIVCYTTMYLFNEKNI